MAACTTFPLSSPERRVGFFYDSETEIRPIPAILPQKGRSDRTTAQPRHLRHQESRRGPRARGSIFQASKLGTIERQPSFSDRGDRCWLSNGAIIG